MPPRKLVDIGIITIREDEFEAVLQRFPEKAETVSFSHRRYRIRRVELTPSQSYTVAVVRCSEQGNGEAQAAARDLLEDLSPSWLFVVGIAGGVPANEFSLGDVVVSTRIADFTVEAVLKDQSREYALAGGPLHTDATKLVADIPGMVFDGELRGWNDEAAIGRARPKVELDDKLFYGDDDWKEDVRKKIKRHFEGDAKRPPLVTTGVIASSDRLIKDTEILQVWLKIARQIQAVEMESAGVYRAVHGRPVRFLAIRGISDVVGYKRHADWTAYACHTAAAFLLAFLHTGVLPTRTPRRRAGQARMGNGPGPEQEQVDASPPLTPVVVVDASPPDTVQLLQALANSDPLVSLSAADALKGRSDLGDQLLDISIHQSPILELAVQTVLKTFPEQSAQLLVSALEHCGTTGETWFRAQRASHLFTPAHKPYAEMAIVRLMSRGTIEQQRHSLLALGKMGCMANYTPEVDSVLDDGYGLQKCFSYAFEGAGYTFILAEGEWELRNSSSFILHLIDLGTKRGVPRGPCRTPLGICTVRHADEILGRWLDSELDRAIGAGLSVLGKIRVARTAAKVLKIWRERGNDPIGEHALGILWCIGERASINALLTAQVDKVTGEGLIHLDEAAFEHFVPQVLADAGTSWLAYRAIGLRRRRDKIPLVRDGLSHKSPVVRGSAALALAHLGEHDGLRKSHQEAHNADERIFTALALLVAGVESYAPLEQELRADLAQGSYGYAIEAQEDILTCLRSCKVKEAEQLAWAWAPFYGRGGNNIYVAIP